MKLQLYILFLSFLVSISFAQNNIGVGTNTPNSSAKLDITSSNSGILIPRVALTAINNASPITSPATSLLVYNTATTGTSPNNVIPGFYYWNGSIWMALKETNTNWNLNGNAGTNSNINFIGTSDNQDIVFKRDNTKAGLIGINNTILGADAFNTTSTGIQNTVVGSNALQNSIDGFANSVFGHEAMKNNTLGNANVAVGKNALYSNKMGSANCAIGYLALASDTYSNNNTAMGYFSMFQNNGGQQNTSVGANSLTSNKTGSYNVAFGYNALQINIVGHANTAIGESSLLNNTASFNTATGTSAMRLNTAGTNNSANGFQALYNNTIGTNNATFGYNSLFNNTIGSYNTAYGSTALNINRAGSKNTAIGYLANVNNDSLINSTAIGANARVDTNNCLVLGGVSGINGATSNVSVGIGTTRPIKAGLQVNHMLGNTTALFSGGANSQGVSLIADIPGLFFNCYYNGTYRAMSSSGYPSLIFTDQASGGMFFQTTNVVNTTADAPITTIERMRITGTGNIGIGTALPQTKLHVVNGSDASLTSGTSGYIITGPTTSTNIVIDDNEIMARNNGAVTDLSLQAEGGNIRIHNVSATTTDDIIFTSAGNLGIGTTVPSYQIELTNNSAAKPGSGTWTIISDKRLKKNIIPFNDGLNIIQKINPISFEYNGETGITDTNRFVGIIAQDIKEIAPYMVGSKLRTNNDGTTKEYLNYDANAMTYILVNSIKEQQVMIDELKKEIELLKNR